MKKILFATTALLGMAVLAQSANAQMTVKMAGDFRFDAGWVSDDVNGAKDFNFQQEWRLPISAEAKADNGLTYGAFLRLRNSGQTVEGLVGERKYLFVGGGFGRVELGDEWGASTKLEVMAPTIGAGQVDGLWSTFTYGGNYLYSHVNEYARSTKISYYTPTLGGFKAGFSYAPERGQRGDWNFGSNSPRFEGIGGHEDQWEAGVNYSGNFGGFGLSAGAVYTAAESETAANEDISAYAVGAQASVAGFTFGGGYWNNGEYGSAGTVDDQFGWNVGVTYAMGDLGLAASYAVTETEPLAGADQTDTVWAIGATYKVAPGLNVFGDLYFFDIESATGAGLPAGGNEGTAFVLRTQVLF